MSLDDFGLNIAERFQAQQGKEFQAQVEYTVTRGKRVIQQNKIVQLPRGCNFKQGKSLLLEAYDLEENKWELVHDDRDVRRRNAEYVGEGEERKRVFKATQVFRAYTVDIKTFPYFFDKRLKRYAVESTMVGDDAGWQASFGNLPWTPSVLYKETMHISALKMAGGAEAWARAESPASEGPPTPGTEEPDAGTTDEDTRPEGPELLHSYRSDHAEGEGLSGLGDEAQPIVQGPELYEMQIEGAHGLWELAVEKDHHHLFTRSILRTLMRTLKPGVAHLVHIVSATVWMLCISARPRRDLCSMGAVSALLKCLKYSMGPGDPIPGVETENQQQLEVFGAAQWLRRRGPTVNPEKMLSHQETAAMVLKGSSGAFARPAPSRKRQAKRAKSLKKIDYAGFDANDTEEEPGALAQGMTRLLKRKGKPRGKKKKGKPKRPKGKDGKGTPEPEEADGEPVETPEEIAAREAEENLKKEQADEKANIVNSLIEYERNHLEALTPNRKNLIKGNTMGALALMMLDETGRADMLENEPKLDTLMALARDQPNPTEMTQAAQRQAVEMLLNIVSRHHDKSALVNFVGAKGVIPHLCDLMESSQCYVRLCSSIVFTQLLNLPGAAAAVSAAGYDQELFKRMVDALSKNVPHLLEEEAEYENPTSVLVNLVNTNATAIWKASLACLPPHGSGVAEEYLVKLVEAADSALLSKQVDKCHHALSGVFAHFSRDPETAAKLVKIESLLPMIKKQLQIEQTRVRICAIAAVGNLGSHGAADIDPGLPAPTAFLVGAYREYLAYHLLEEMQRSSLRGCRDGKTAEERDDLDRRLQLVGACANMWLASTACATRENTAVMDNLLQMIESAKDVEALVYLMPSLWLMARSDHNREYLVAAPSPNQRAQGWEFDYVPSQEQEIRRLEMQEDFTLAWSGPMGERSNFPAFGQNPGHEETGDAADVGTWKPTFFHSQRSGKPLALSRTQTGVSLLYDEMASEDFNAPAAKGTVDEPTEAVGGFGGRMTSKAKKSYEAMARARDKISAEDPVIKTMNNSWCMNILAKVGRDHVSELDGEEDEDSWVAQMYGYWTGAIWLVMYTDSDSPWQVEDVFELRDNGWWSVPPKAPDVEIMGERTAVTVDVVDVLIEVCNTSGRGTYTVRRLVTGVLWNLAVLDFGLEIRMVEKGLPEVLKRTAVDKDVHVKARQWSAAFLHRLAQRKNGGGWQIISDVGLELMQSDEPLLVQTGLRMIANACNQKAEKLRLGVQGLIPMLIKVLQVAPLLMMPFAVAKPPEADGEQGATKRNAKRESALIRGKFCHMTVENMERWRSDRVTSPNFLLDAPEFDPHFGDQDEDCREREDTPFTKPACLFALFSILNLSTHDRNQEHILKQARGFETLLNTNFFFKAMVDEQPAPQTAEEYYTRYWSELMCHYSSSVLHNCRKQANNQTLMYKMGLIRNRRQEQEGDDFNPFVGFQLAPSPFAKPEVGLALVRGPASKRARTSALGRLTATRAEFRELKLSSSGDEPADRDHPGELEDCTAKSAEEPLEEVPRQSALARSDSSESPRRSIFADNRPRPATSPATSNRPLLTSRTGLNQKPRNTRKQESRWGSCHSRFKAPPPLDSKQRRRKAVEDDQKREEFLSWMNENKLDEKDDVPSYMKPTPQVKPEDVETIKDVLEADIEAHSQLKYINKKLASNSAMWTSLPNESNFGPRKGKARWEPEIHEYTLLNEEPQPGLSLVAAKLLLSKRPTSAFRRLTDAAEWVAKAASEDRLAINGGHMPRPFVNNLGPLETFVMPSLSETDSDRGEGMEEGNQSLPALARNQSIIRTEPRRPGMPEPESFVVDGDEDLEGPEASVASRSLSRTTKGKSSRPHTPPLKAPTESPLSPKTPRHKSPSRPGTSGSNASGLNASVAVFRALPRPRTSPAPDGRETFKSTGRLPARLSTHTLPSRLRASAPLTKHASLEDSVSEGSFGSFLDSRPPTRASVAASLSTTDFCLTQRIPTSPGLWNEDESDYVINGAPLTNMIPPDSTPGGEQDLPELLPVNVVMSPGGARHCIRFSRSLDAVVNNDGKVSMFEHVNGSKVFRTLYPYYYLPNGSKAFFYYKGSDLVDEVTFPLELSPRRPTTLAGLYRSRLPHDPPLVREASPEAVEPPVGLRPVPALGMPPMQHSLDVNEPPAYYGDLKLRNVAVSLIPIEVSKEEEIEIIEDAPQGPPWKIEESIWAGRPKEIDARDFWDGDKAYDKGFSCDWGRLTTKEKFVNFLDRESKKHKSKLSTEEVTTAVGNLIRKEYEFLSRLYRYYSALSSSKPSGMPLNDWTELLTCADIPNNDSARCKMSDCDTVFITANYMEKKEKDIDDNALGRFQFIEALCRLSTLKYPASPEEALKKLFNNNLHGNLPMEATFDPNQFRTERFYNEEVDILLTSKKKVLEALHSRYRLPPKSGERRNKMMCLTDFLSLCFDVGLYTGHFTERTARMCYAYSKPLYGDEFGNIVKFMEMTFYDFTEALGHAADMVDLPTREDLNMNGYKDVLEYHHAIKNDPNLALDVRDSAHFRNPKTRPLADKLGLLLELIFKKLDYSDHQGYMYSDAQFIKKLVQIDRALGP